MADRVKFLAVIATMVLAVARAFGDELALVENESAEIAEIWDVTSQPKKKPIYITVSGTSSKNQSPVNEEFSEQRNPRALSDWKCDLDIQRTQRSQQQLKSSIYICLRTNEVDGQYPVITKRKTGKKFRLYINQSAIGCKLRKQSASATQFICQQISKQESEKPLTAPPADVGE